MKVFQTLRVEIPMNGKNILITLEPSDITLNDIAQLGPLLTSIISVLVQAVGELIKK